jgi:hypothetical protein
MYRKAGCFFCRISYSDGSIFFKGNSKAIQRQFKGNSKAIARGFDGLYGFSRIIYNREKPV